MNAVVIPAVFAVMTVDPGRTTGVAWGVFRTAGTVKQTLIDADVESCEIVAGPVGTGIEVSRRWQDFFASANIDGCPTPEISLVLESFALRTAHADTSPVAVTAAIATCVYLQAPMWDWDGETQSPSEAKGYARDDRLRDWGLWVRGSEHQRDARRHLALKVAKTLAEV